MKFELKEKPYHIQDVESEDWASCLILAVGGQKLIISKNIFPHVYHTMIHVAAGIATEPYASQAL